MRKIKNIIICATLCLALGGGINTFASASGNVANTMFHFTATGTSYTGIQYKLDSTRTYAIVSDGLSSAKATVMGTNRSYTTYSNACSSECTLKKYTEYTIKNNVYGNYRYAVLRTKSAGSTSGSGYWSPDSTKNYTNIG